MVRPKTSSKREKRLPNSNFDLDKFLREDYETIVDVIGNIRKHVSEINIPKKDGSNRRVLAPSKVLKSIQTTIYWKVLKKYQAHDAAHGFVYKRGIVSNAIPHIGAKSLGKIDIKSFFDSITRDHLNNVLFGNTVMCKFCIHNERMLRGECDPSMYKNAKQEFKSPCEELLAIYTPGYCEETGYRPLFKNIIDLCTINGVTCQGFPTSPTLANIVMKGFDKNMVARFEPLGITYTRYADDLCFSSKTMTADQLKSCCQEYVYQQLWAFGFKANKKKTSWRQRTGRLRVCGVVVNEKLSITRKDVKMFRAKVHNMCVKFPKDVTKKDWRSAKGWASFLLSVDKKHGRKYYDQLQNLGKVRGWVKPDDLNIH